MATGLTRMERWFAEQGWEPWAFQRAAWAAHARGESGIVQVGTGAGKTYAAYIGALAELIDEIGGGASTAEDRNAKHTQATPVEGVDTGETPLPRGRGVRATRKPKGSALGLRILYVTPLRAVARDIEQAMRRPVDDLEFGIRVESRTGDTSASVRARQREVLPEVLVTTPESLTLMLTRANAREQLRDVRCVIVDEWHELISTKRGTQTELALARLRRFSCESGDGRGLRVWGLSATLPNLEEAARALVGVGATPTIVRGDMPREVVIDSILPGEGRRLAWAGHLGLTMLPDVAAALDPAVSTLVFTNTRSQAERWYHGLCLLRPEWQDVMALHHGSIDRGERERVEAGLKDGSVRIVVATSSLDLGVDFTPVERVLQIGSPKGIARIVQRAGRSSHRPRTPCRITCVPTHALELVEIAAVRLALSKGDVEPRRPLDKPLDVLVQHLVTCAMGGGFVEEEMFEEVRSAWSYRELTRDEFDWAMAIVRHGGPALTAYPDFQRVVEVNGRLGVQNSRIERLHRMNVGTITSDGTLEIRFLGGRSLGRIEESFVGGLKEGEKFVFAGRVLAFVGVRDLVAFVRPASGRTTYTPIWSGTKLPISESLSSAIREMIESARTPSDDGVEMRSAARLFEVQRRESVVPSRDEVLIETCKTSEGRHLFVFPFEGRLVHAGLASLLTLRLSRRTRASLAAAVNDYGFEILSDGDEDLGAMIDSSLFDASTLETDIIEAIYTSQLARLAFRDVARIAGLVVQTVPGMRKSASQIQASAGLMFDVLSEFDPENLLLAQARREVTQRHYEQSRLGRALMRLESSRLRIVATRRPTPLSFPLLIERQSTRLTSASIVERVERMRAAWENAESWTRESSETKSGSKSSTGWASWDLGPPPAPKESTPRRRGRRAFGSGSGRRRGV
ncbi:MAG: ligase-associated DNA damage response DEXH box helicase [Phycisphaerales bacterium]